ncbi:proteophosphoglycan precursor, partial [Roseovarius sp. HI0049]
PPVHLWTPDLSGDIDIRIARDGTWFHEGTPINREGLVRLFSTILKREGDDYFLVTPVEKWRIEVEDAPFVAVDFEAEGAGAQQSLIFETNVGDRVVAGEETPIRVERDEETGEPSPYVMIRDGLEALIDRKSFYRLVETGEAQDGWFGLWS